MRPAAASKLSSGLRLHRTYRVQSIASLIDDNGVSRVQTNQIKTSITSLASESDLASDIDAVVEDVWQYIINSSSVRSPNSGGHQHPNDRCPNRLQTTNHRRHAHESAITTYLITDTHYNKYIRCFSF